jgi:dTDP-4-dehydrorhamnose reductase
VSKYVVVGASGLVGSHLAVALADRDVTLVSRSGGPGAPFDILDRHAVEALLRRESPGTVFVAAAQASVEKCEVDPVSTSRVNVSSIEPFVDWASETNGLLVVISSEYVFDGSDGPYDETARTAPLNEYGRQKVRVEGLVARVERHLICRTSGVFGWERARRNFVCQLVDRLRVGEPMAVPSDQLITPTYAPSLASAMVELADADAEGTFHVAGPCVISRVEFARMVVRRFGLREELILQRPTEALGLRAKRPQKAGLRTEKVAAALGHSLVTPDLALREMVATEQ